MLTKPEKNYRPLSGFEPETPKLKNFFGENFLYKPLFSLNQALFQLLSQNSRPNPGPIFETLTFFFEFYLQISSPKTFARIVEANLLDYIAHHLLVIHIRLACDLPAQHYHPSFGDTFFKNAE